MYLFYPPAVSKVRLWQAEPSAGRSEVILVVVIEVSTEPTGVALIGAWHTHFQMWATTPQYLKVNQLVYTCVTESEGPYCFQPYVHHKDNERDKDCTFSPMLVLSKMVFVCRST